MVNQQFRDALHILLALAFAGEMMDSRQLAASINTNPVVVRRLLQSLRRSGLVTVCPGRNGGAALCRKPSEISLLEIYEAVRPAPAIGICHRKTRRGCPVSCSMKEIMSDLAARTERAVRRDLRTTKLSGLLRRVGGEG